VHAGHGQLSVAGIRAEPRPRDAHPSAARSAQAASMC